MPNPLPDLRARDFRRGGVFHQVENRDGAAASQPGLEILYAYTHVRAQTLFSDRAARIEIEQVFRANMDIVTLARDLVRLWHQAVECFGGELDHSGMRHPRSIVTIACFAFLVP